MFEARFNVGGRGSIRDEIVCASDGETFEERAAGDTIAKVNDVVNDGRKAGGGFIRQIGILRGKDDLAEGLEAHAIVTMVKPDHGDAFSGGAVSARVDHDGFVHGILGSGFEGRLYFFAGMDVVSAVLQRG